MAVSKEILNNKKKNKTNTPELLGEIPVNNPEHYSAPVGMHHPIPPKPVVYNTMQEAVNMCERIFLKPGEAHTEFYKSEINGNIKYHCVVAIGNANPNNEHLYLTDSGKNKSIDESLNDMANEIILLKKSFMNLDENFTDLSDNISEFEIRIDTAIDSIRNDINIFENNINNELTLFENNINNSINTISNTVNTFINDSSNKINDISIRTTEQIENINTYVSSFDNRINNLSNNIIDLSTSIDNKLNELNNKLDNELSINLIQNTSINLLDNSFNLFTSDFNDKIINLSTSLNEISDDLNEKIYIESVINNIQNVSISLLDETLNLFINKVDDLSINTNNKFVDLNNTIENEISINISQDNSINLLNSSFNALNSSINDLTLLINEYEPISDSSIGALFHYDIYTINLCCYSEGGHIEIYDDVSGGVDPRVADCTPKNEYKTYVTGDEVILKAVPNTNNGYRFVRWYRNHIEWDIHNEVRVEFFDKDIPVIGTLANDIEPEILNEGYTALFMKLNLLKLHVYTNTNTSDVPVLYSGDAVNITITEDNGNVYHYTANDTSIFYPNNSKITISAIPGEHGHTFNEYIINGLHITTPNITYNNIYGDLDVNVYFKEWWIMVTADATPQYMGLITSNEGIGNYKLYNTTVDLNAVAKDGYKFVKWYSNQISDAQLENSIISGNLRIPLIILKINYDISEYELFAEFTTI